MKPLVTQKQRWLLAAFEDPQPESNMGFFRQYYEDDLKYLMEKYLILHDRKSGKYQSAINWEAKVFVEKKWHGFAAGTLLLLMLFAGIAALFVIAATIGG